MPAHSVRDYKVSEDQCYFMVALVQSAGTAEYTDCISAEG